MTQPLPASGSPDEPEATEEPAAPPGAEGLAAMGLCKRYGKREVVRDVSLHVGPGEIVGLLGPNGAGKTTTFYMIVGLVPANRGIVRLGEYDISGLPMYRRARRGISYLPQEPSTFRKLTVYQNIQAIVETLSIPRKERRAVIEQHLAELGLEGVARQKAYTLSGGERRRLEISRALVANPRFMLLDEPFSGVDPISVAEVQDLVVDLARRGIGVLITDHNVRETLRIVDRAYILTEGRVLREGNRESLVSDPEVRASYLGGRFEL
ncbi:MAG: LPS export ABC transporter ATP-binding protein [Opitutales bacterium]